MSAHVVVVVAVGHLVGHLGALFGHWFVEFVQLMALESVVDSVGHLGVFWLAWLAGFVAFLIL